MFLAVADYLVYDILSLSPDTSFGAALHFFVYDVLKILFLLSIIIFSISFLQTYLNPQKIKTYIEKQPKFLAHFLAALFGAATPFCSCSSIPVFIGFIEAKIPFGIAMSFLITSPMINEIAMLVLAGILGIKITLIYIAAGISIGMLGGFLLEKLGYAKYLQDYLRLNTLQFAPAPVLAPPLPPRKYFSLHAYKQPLAKQKSFCAEFGFSFYWELASALFYTAMCRRNFSCVICRQTIFLLCL